MKQHEYTDGPQALETFERGMKALFKVSKAAIVQGKKKPKKALPVRDGSDRTEISAATG
jgi:hypothetical protein